MSVDSDKEDSPITQQPKVATVGPPPYGSRDYTYASINSSAYPNRDHTVNSSNQRETGRQYSDSNQPLLAEEDNVVPDHYLGFSICVTLCCCLPLGIAAIVFSAAAMQSIGARDYRAARESGKTARNLAIAGFVMGLLIIALAIFLNIIVRKSYQ